MQSTVSTRLHRAMALLAGLLIFKVTAEVMLGYHQYLPPNFRSDFLRGRELYFFDGYHLAFYAHIASGPTSLIFGMLLVSPQFRQRFPSWHRCLGRLQVANVLLLVTPSALWMACYTSTGRTAAAGFAVLAVLTAMSVSLGWRAAVKRRFLDHRRWMWRCFLLLCSAVVIRLFGGLATVIGVEAPWFNPTASWASWLLPLSAFEIHTLIDRRRVRSLVGSRRHWATADPASVDQPSSPAMEIQARR